MFFSKINAMSRQAFSLVEVVIALGVTSFAVLALIGTLPTGIKSVQDSSNESAKANITQEIRAELQEINFGSTTSGGSKNIANLSSKINYYDNNGDILAGSTGAYYKATFAVTPTTIPGSSYTFQSGAAQTIAMILTYPLSAANPNTSTNYLLAAKQKNY